MAKAVRRTGKSGVSSAAAARKRRERERKRSGIILTRPIEVTPCAVETLIEAGFLPAWSSDDPAAVARAVETLLSRFEGVTL